MAKKIMITGSAGFIGRVLVNRLALDGSYTPMAVVREKKQFQQKVKQIVVPDITSSTGWEIKLKNVNTVIHLAALAHDVKKKRDITLDEYRKINTYATLNLAKQAVNAGVQRFIFVSSISVNGTISSGKSFTEVDVPCPAQPYAISKYEAEAGLLSIAEQTNC